MTSKYIFFFINDLPLLMFLDSVKTSEADNGSITSLDNSFEMFPATIPPYQPRRESIDGSDDAKSKEPFTPFSKAKISLENRSPKVRFPHCFYCHDIFFYLSITQLNTSVVAV